VHDGGFPGTFTGWRATSNGRNSSGIFAVALNTESFTPDYLINPSDDEATPVGGADTDLDWAGNFDNEPHNFSYANLYFQEDAGGPQESGRVTEWQESFNSRAIVLGDRLIGSGNTRSSIWTDLDSGRWEGTITNNDNSTNFQNTDEDYETSYGKTDIEGDSLFETDGTIVGGGAAPNTNGTRTDCRLFH